jgi:hypothetical protein
MVLHVSFGSYQESSSSVEVEVSVVSVVVLAEEEGTEEKPSERQQSDQAEAERPRLRCSSCYTPSPPPLSREYNCYSSSYCYNGNCCCWYLKQIMSPEHCASVVISSLFSEQ